MPYNFVVDSFLATL